MRSLQLLSVLLLATSVGCGSCDSNDHAARPFVISPGPGISTTSLAAGIPGTEAGQTLAWDGTAWGVNSYTSDPSRRYTFVSEFEVGTTCTSIEGGKFVGALSGTGATCTYATNALGHPGVLAMETGTTATGGDRFSQGAWVALGQNDGTYCSKWLVSFLNLSTTTIEYLGRFGFNEPASNADSVDAVQMIYDRARAVALVGGGGNFWIAETSNNSVRTEIVLDGSTQGGVTTVAQPITAGTWYTIETCVNPAGTSSTFRVNGVLSATVTTNIPIASTAARQTSVGAQCFNNTGSVPADQICYVDYTRTTVPFGSAR